MAIYSEYLDRSLNQDFKELTRERKRQLKRIADLRGRDVLVYAADLNKGRAQISIDYPDLLPIQDQLENLRGNALDLVLETPGGSGEVAEDIVRLLRDKFDDLGVIVPGWAKSAGTLIAMAGDEILMGPVSALGPIDAQLSWQGKTFSADALLEGFEKIKAEVLATGGLNKAYIPILQGISPGELQTAENAMKFAKSLVENWLANYKFRRWTQHSKTGAPVTDDERSQRADEIATQLCDHSRWLTHGRSIKIDDFREMRLLITDYSKNAELFDAVQRYYTLLQMTFAGNIYKIFETPESTIHRFEVQPFQAKPDNKMAGGCVVQVRCPHCQHEMKVQADLGTKKPLKPGCEPFPADAKLKCRSCGTEIDLAVARRQIEAQTKQPVIVGTP